MKTLKDEWRFYRDACYPHAITVTQNRECHQAFFAGCLVAVKLITEASVKMPEKEAEKFISGIMREASEMCRIRAEQLKGNN